jgi:transcriptional regulator with XRE-family HTH domain
MSARFAMADVLRFAGVRVCEVGWHVREELENLGRRIAERRAKLGWTQQELAERLAVSRTAVSHLEAGMTVPGERTLVLLAGVFKTEPHELVAGTNYPVAKAERLPAVAARYTELELLLALLDNDISWIERAGESHRRRTMDEWDARLASVDEHRLDLRERELLRDARQRVRVSRD